MKTKHIKYHKDGKQAREWMTYDKNGKLMKKTNFNNE